MRLKVRSARESRYFILAIVVEFLWLHLQNGDKIQFKCGILTRDLDALRDKLVEEQVGEIDMESISVYWCPIWCVLESDFKLYLANPFAIKQLPGRQG